MHAEVSAQLARSWGNAQFGDLEPRHAVVLGAQLHDIGWVEWERNPSFNAETGLPHSFLELPIEEHLKMWGIAARSALAFGRYPALLTSMHGTNLYRNRDLDRLPESDAQGIRQFLDAQSAFQREMRDSLGSDQIWAPFVAEPLLVRNQRLVAIWDAMSLALCGTQRGPRSFGHVPLATGEIEVTLDPTDDRVVVQPWPFRDDTVFLTFEARRFSERAETADAYSRTLSASPWETVRMTLRPD
jgi:hypothetical protein